MSHVLILAGGLSHERDVSLRSGRRLGDVLNRAGHEAHVRDLDSSLISILTQNPPELVWPTVHGAAGEDGALADVLETLGVPYVGSPPDICRLSWDKAVCKAVVRTGGVDTPASVALPHSTFRELGAGVLLAAVVERIGLPLVVKPTCGGSALGLTIVHELDQLPQAMVGAYAYGDIALLEAFVAGREVTFSIIEDADGKPQALPAVEIVPDGGVYTYDARYTAGATEFVTPARLTPSEAEAAAATAMTAHRVLGLRHISRVDVMVDAHGRPWFMEANISPGLTETSLLPMAITAAGLDLGDAYSGIIAAALP